MVKIEPEFAIEEYVHTVINDTIYRMLIHSYECSLNGENIQGAYTLIHSKSEYNNKTKKSETEIFKTVEELIEVRNEKMKKQAIKFQTK